MVLCSLSNQDREDFARLQRGYLALELRGRLREASQIRRGLIARAKYRLTKEESAWLWMCLGDAYVRAAAARRAYLRAIALDPTHAESTYALGDLEFRNGNHDTAERLVDQMMALDIDRDLQSLAFSILPEKSTRHKGDDRTIEVRTQSTWPR